MRIFKHFIISFLLLLPSVVSAAPEFMVVWDSLEAPSTIRGQRLSSTGSAIGSEFIIPSDDTGYEYNPALDHNTTDGNFMVVFGNGYYSPYGISARRFTSTGVAIGNEFAVATSYPYVFYSDISFSPSSSRFLVVWGDYVNDTINAQVLTSTGVSVGANFQVNTTAIGNRSEAIDAEFNSYSGEWVVLWYDELDSTSVVSPCSGTRVRSSHRAQRISTAGSLVGAEFQINTSGDTTTRYLAGSIDFSTVGGDMIALYTRRNAVSCSTSFVDARAKRFSSTGTVIGTEFAVNSSETYSQFSWDIANISDNFILTWDSLNQESATSQEDVYLRKFSSTGTALTGEVTIPQSVNHAQDNVSVAPFPDETKFMIVWQSGNPSFSPDLPTQDGSSGGIFGRTFDTSGASVGSDFQVNTTVSGLQYLPVVSGFELPTPTPTPTSTPTPTNTTAPCAEVSWTGEENISADDGSYAVSSETSTDNTFTDRLSITNFGIDFTDGETPTGIEVCMVGGQGNTTGLIVSEEVMLIDTGTVQPYNNSGLEVISKLDPSDSSKDPVICWGGVNDLWGRDWTEAAVENVGFGVALRFSSHLGADIKIDHVYIRVYGPQCSDGTSTCVDGVCATYTPTNTGANTATPTNTPTITSTPTVTNTPIAIPETPTPVATCAGTLMVSGLNPAGHCSAVNSDDVVVSPATVQWDSTDLCSNVCCVYEQSAITSFVPTGANSKALRISDFVLAPLSNSATINGVRLLIRKGSEGNSGNVIHDSSVTLSVGGERLPADKADTATDWCSSNAPCEWSVYGGYNDTWGGTIVPEDIGTLTVDFQVQNDTGCFGVCPKALIGCTLLEICYSGSVLETPTPTNTPGLTLTPTVIPTFIPGTPRPAANPIFYN